MSSSAAVPQRHRTVREDSTEIAQSFHILVNAACEIGAIASGNKQLARRLDISQSDVARAAIPKWWRGATMFSRRPRKWWVRPAVRSDAGDDDRVEEED